MFNPLAPTIQPDVAFARVVTAYNVEFIWLVVFQTVHVPLYRNITPLFVSPPTAQALVELTKTIEYRFIEVLLSTVDQREPFQLIMTPSSPTAIAAKLVKVELEVEVVLLASMLTALRFDDVGLWVLSPVIACPYTTEPAESKDAKSSTIAILNENFILDFTCLKNQSIFTAKPR